MMSTELLRREVTLTFSPMGLQILDTFVNAAPTQSYDVRLEHFDGTHWVDSGHAARISPSGFLIYPGLERRAQIVPGQPPRLYRACVESDFYVPAYRRTADGREFPAFAYNDTNPPFLPASSVGLLALSPSAAYVYPPDVRVLRGSVSELNGAPVRDALIEYAAGQVEAMTDARGYFALGLKRAPETGAITLDIHHDRTNRVRSRSVQLPAALQSNQALVIN
jgi:hypothetical protein